MTRNPAGGLTESCACIIPPATLQEVSQSPVLASYHQRPCRRSHRVLCLHHTTSDPAGGNRGPCIARDPSVALWPCWTLAGPICVCVCVRVCVCVHAVVCVCVCTRARQFMAAGLGPSAAHMLGPPAASLDSKGGQGDVDRCCWCPIAQAGTETLAGGKDSTMAKCAVVSTKPAELGWPRWLPARLTLAKQLDGIQTAARPHGTRILTNVCACSLVCTSPARRLAWSWWRSQAACPTARPAS